MNRDAIKEKAQTLYEDTLYSEKALFWLATQWRRSHYAIGIPSCIVSAAAGASLLKDMPVLAAVLTTVAAVLTALLTFLDPKSTYARYHDFGVRYGILRNKIDRFKDIDLYGKFDENQARATLEALASEKGELQEAAPHTGGLAYFYAKRSIRSGEHEPDNPGA
jgi:hypothetical protein